MQSEDFIDDLWYYIGKFSVAYGNHKAYLRRNKISNESCRLADELGKCQDELDNYIRRKYARKIRTK